MNNRAPLFILAVLVVAALITTTIVTHAPTWEIIYVAFVAILIAIYALWWLIRGDNGHG